MPLNVLIVPDKFKGTLSAGEAARAIARGWRKARPLDTLTLLPMSDAGDGFGEVMSSLLGATAQTIRTVDAAHRRCTARWWWEPKSRTALIESAKVIGLAMLPPKRFHPFGLDTFGLGAVIRAAATRGARRCFVGVGGSATNDGGFGLARALGWQFLDAAGRALESWTDLHRLARINPPERRRWFEELIVAVDVTNPLLGARGATRVYGPQKGLKPSQFSGAERNLRQLARIAGSGHAAAPGAGAAGGLGFGLLAFAGARLESGFDLFARFAKLKERLRPADLVITGEGRLDASSLMGKGVGQIARGCSRLKIPCLALVGTPAESGKVRNAFTNVRALTDLATAADAQANAASCLERLAHQSAKSLLRPPAAVAAKVGKRR